jgi:hypothetical protein
MELIATITSLSAATCIVALVVIVWSYAERADKRS